jgi:hypothetical protein
VSVSVDPPRSRRHSGPGLGARWTFLSDSDRHYQAELGLRETTDTVHRPYRPASFGNTDIFGGSYADPTSP